MKQWTAFLIFALLATTVMNCTADSYERLRQKMVDVIVAEVIETANYTGRRALDARVLEAMEHTPRHEFVPGFLRRYAYENQPLPIGQGQTISQPYIVAIMTDFINPQRDHVVLEIGTGSGYQAAVLSALVDKVFSIEIIPELADAADKTLKKLNYKNVFVRTGDGYKGWPEEAPFDSIIVTAGGSVPAKLLEQLKPGGRMIIPVGSVHSAQELTLIEKNAQGQLKERRILPVRFVPLMGGDN